MSDRKELEPPVQSDEDVFVWVVFPNESFFISLVNFPPFAMMVVFFGFVFGVPPNTALEREREMSDEEQGKGWVFIRRVVA